MEGLSADDPRRIGGYRLLGKLGEGGMGRVYLARSERGRTVAVKVVQNELSRSPDFRRRFAQEVVSAQRVGDRWTAPVLDSDTEAETPWVATGYVPGPSLAEVVGEQYGPLPEPSVRALAGGLSHALQAIHGAGLVHRDLKPSNVLVTVDGPRVIDFGIARALDTAAQSVHGLTKTGAVVGSPGFISPEQVRGQRVTPASDVFCLGTVLAYAATGHTPFGTPEGSVHSLLFSISEDEPDLERVPEELRPLIGACLAKDPDRRPALDALLETLGADAQPDGAWLPGQVLAQLGRHAAQLLDSEDPEAQADAGTDRSEQAALTGGAAAYGGVGSGSSGSGSAGAHGAVAAGAASPLPGAPGSPGYAPPTGSYGPASSYLPAQPAWHSPPPPGPQGMRHTPPGGPVPPGAVVRPGEPRRTRTLAAWLTVLLSIALALLLVSAFVYFSISSNLTSARTAPDSPVESAPDFDSMLLGSAFLQLVTALTTTGVSALWVCWFRRARLNAEAFKPGGIRYGDGMSIGAWFIPVGNLFIPKQISDDIWAASMPATRFSRRAGALPGQSPYTVKRGALQAWWSTWVPFQIFHLATSVLTWDSAVSVSASSDYALFQTFASVLGVVSAVFALVFVRKLSKAQDARITGVAPR